VVPDNMDALDWSRKHLDAEGSDLLREMVRTFAERLMAAEVEELCNAGYGDVTPERTTAVTGVGLASSTPGWGRSICRSGSCGRAAISRAGCSGPADGPRVRWWGWWPSVTCGPVDLAGRGAGPDPRDRAPVEVPGPPHGQRARRPGGRVSKPAARWRPLHLGATTIAASIRPRPGRRAVVCACAHSLCAFLDRRRRRSSGGCLRSTTP
jgi:hypothetical protein